MGCKESKSARNARIEKGIKNDMTKSAEELKLLLLGPGESGKSTIFKQMKIIQKNGGYSQKELQEYKYIIYGNVITQMKVVVTVALKLNIELKNKQNEERAQRIAQVAAGGDEIARDIKALWEDAGIQQAYAMRDRKYHLNESAAYFFDNIDRFMAPDYIASYQVGSATRVVNFFDENSPSPKKDVLRARVRTTGIQESVFIFDNMRLRLLDVGGQRSERRKWIHCFDSVSAVLFVVSLSEFDQTLREGKENRMLESLALFDDICNSRWFSNTSFILFLNKTDLFREKIERIDMKDHCFPTYTGGKNYEAGTAFIKQRFLERNLTQNVIFGHFTCAISTDKFEFVFNAVRSTIISQIVERRGGI